MAAVAQPGPSHGGTGAVTAPRPISSHSSASDSGGESGNCSEGLGSELEELPVGSSGDEMELRELRDEEDEEGCNLKVVAMAHGCEDECGGRSAWVRIERLVNCCKFASS